MFAFVRRNLDPVDRLGEILFGLIMAMGFTGAVRLGLDAADSRALFVGILGCNIAWGIVDGVMYVLSALFERSHRERLVRDVLAAKTDEAALARIGDAFDDRLGPFVGGEERDRLYAAVLRAARQRQAQRPRVKRDDILGGIAVGVIVLLATAPMLVPYLVVADAELAVRLSHGTGIALIFMVGWWWARATGASPWRLGTGLALLGSVLVLITIALGG